MKFDNFISNIDSYEYTSKQKSLLKILYENKIAPNWALDKFDLDQFYTSNNIAMECFNTLINELKKEKINLNKYTFIEPSAGTGSFYNLLPEKKRIGFDIDPKAEGIIKKDFLTLNLEKENKKYIAIGNPPFGYRNWMALAFLNKCSSFCDYVGFILPMGFQNKSKGSPIYRVKNMGLIYSKHIKNNLFKTKDGLRKINCVFQIWSKNKEQKRYIEKDVSESVEIYTVDKAPFRKCGLDKMNSYNFFIQRSFFSHGTGNLLLKKDFNNIKNGCAYGFIIKKNKSKILKILKETDWSYYSNKTTHNCFHICKYHIKERLWNFGIR